MRIQHTARKSQNFLRFEVPYRYDTEILKLDPDKKKPFRSTTVITFLHWEKKTYKLQNMLPTQIINVDMILDWHLSVTQYSQQGGLATSVYTWLTCLLSRFFSVNSTCLFSFHIIIIFTRRSLYSALKPLTQIQISIVSYLARIAGYGTR
jgi:hypothetical protein